MLKIEVHLYLDVAHRRNFEVGVLKASNCNGFSVRIFPDFKEIAETSLKPLNGAKLINLRLKGEKNDKA